MRRIRSLLFAPANRPDFLEKFTRYRADAYVIDLEDGTPEADKAPARRELPGVVERLRAQGLQGLLFVRANRYNSPHADADLETALAAPADGIVMPKLESVEGLRFFVTALAEAESRTGRRFQLLGIVETASGVLNVEALAMGADPHLTTLAFGAEDFITDVDGRRTPAGLEVLYARSRVVLAARAAGLEALDQVFVNIRDEEAFRRDAELGRQLGYNGKMCVVPRQIDIANEVFSPSPAEIDRCRRLIEAYEAAQASGRGTIDFEGQMIDEPLLKRARAILEKKPG